MSTSGAIFCVNFYRDFVCVMLVQVSKSLACWRNVSYPVASCVQKKSLRLVVKTWTKVMKKLVTCEIWAACEVLCTWRVQEYETVPCTVSCDQFEWQAGEWSVCTTVTPTNNVQCGPGIQSRSVRSAKLLFPSSIMPRLHQIHVAGYCNRIQVSRTSNLYPDTSGYMSPLCRVNDNLVADTRYT